MMATRKPGPPRKSPVPLSPGKRLAFAVIAVALPFLLLGCLEVGLRLGKYGKPTPLFEPPEAFAGRYLAPARNVAARFFPSEQFPPTPPNDLFLAEKPEHGVRIFALGESSTAGFPYPPNAMFTRLVADALTDALPGDTVEVINLGIAATNSYALVDFADEVLEQKPDAILIYAGHNEYYGALGVGSTESLGAFPGFVRLYLNLQRLRTFLLLRNSIRRLAGMLQGQDATDASSPSRMENVARDQRIELGGSTYSAGVRQYTSNIGIVMQKFRDAGVPVFIGSLVSNVRDQEPLSFLSGGGAAAAGSKATFDSAVRLIAAGDSIAAKPVFERARDRDVVRFRAPSEFNAVIKRLAAAHGATYVPVAEKFAAASTYGIPGNDLILEHVHPSSRGYALLGQAFVEALVASGKIKRADHTRLRPWAEYQTRMSLTEMDQRIAHHEVKTVTTRWPFVPFSRQQDYRGTYVPTDRADSLAFLVSRGGITWTAAKSQLAESYAQAGDVDKAVMEYDGLIRNFPHSEPPLSLAAKVLLAAQQNERARSYLERAFAVRPTGYNTFALGVLALQRRDGPVAIEMLQTSVRIAPRNPDALYQLSLAYAFVKNAEAARETAIRLYRIAPDYPGLTGWLELLGSPSR